MLGNNVIDVHAGAGFVNRYYQLECLDGNGYPCTQYELVADSREEETVRRDLVAGKLKAGFTVKKILRISEHKYFTAYPPF